MIAAVQANNTTAVQALIAAPGIDVNIQDKDGVTALNIAEARGHGDIINLLRRHRATE